MFCFHALLTREGESPGVSAKLQMPHWQRQGEPDHILWNECYRLEMERK